MMGRRELTLFESMFPYRFPTLGVFKPKSGPKGNFVWKNKDFSLWYLCSPVSPGLQGAVMSKTMGGTELMLLEAMFPNRV